MQQTFLSVLEHLDSFREEGAVADLAATNRHQPRPEAPAQAARPARPSRWKFPADDPDDSYAGLPHPEYIAHWRDGPEELAQRAEVRRLIDQALTELDDKYRLVFVLRDVEGLSVRETAEALGLTETDRQGSLAACALLTSRAVDPRPRRRDDPGVPHARSRLIAR